MWILLMIIFSQPYQVSNREIRGTYGSKKSCTQEAKRALTFDVPVKSSFGCILIENLNNLQNVSHGTKGGNMSHSGNDEIIDNKRDNEKNIDREKWLIASTCIKCEEIGDVAHTAFAQDKDADGNFTPYIFDSQKEAELYITKVMKEDLDYVWATPQKENM